MSFAMRTSVSRTHEVVTFRFILECRGSFPLSHNQTRARSASALGQKGALRDVSGWKKARCGAFPKKVENDSKGVLHTVIS